MNSANEITDPSAGAFLSIGELSRRTGLSVLRIRAWETRHGVPQSRRSAGGQRRYSMDQVVRLEFLAQAVRSGHRIGWIADLPDDELTALAPEATVADGAVDDPWIAAVREGRESDLHGLLTRAWKKDGWRRFLEGKAIPFLHAIGSSWESGDLGVAQEHFASGILASFVEEKWRTGNRRLSGRPVVLAILPDDPHAFGLHFSAVAAVEAGQRVAWLGPHSPVSAILAAARRWNATGVVISVPGTSDSATSQAFLSAIRHELPRETTLYAGGSGLHRRLRGIHSFHSPGEFHEHLVELRSRS